MRAAIFGLMLVFSAANFAEETCAEKLARIASGQCCLTIIGCPLVIFIPDIWCDAYNSLSFVDIFESAHQYQAEKASGGNPSFPQNVQGAHDNLVMLHPETHLKPIDILTVLEEIGQGSSKSAACQYFYGFQGYPIEMIFREGNLDYYNFLKGLPLNRKEQEQIISEKYRQEKDKKLKEREKREGRAAKIRDGFSTESSSSDEAIEL